MENSSKIIDHLQNGDVAPDSIPYVAQLSHRNCTSSSWHFENLKTEHLK